MSALTFACYDRSCRPPTSGGTGGSSKKSTGPGPEPKFAGRGANETQAEWNARYDQYIKDKNEWLNKRDTDPNRKPNIVDKLNAMHRGSPESPVTLGRKTPQSSEVTPPEAYGAGKWKKGKDGVWESKGEGQAAKKMAVQDSAGNWIVAHVLNSRSLPTRDEMVGMLRHAAKLNDDYPLPIRPELVIGDFTAKKIVGKHSGGFTLSGSQRGRTNEFIKKGFNVTGDDIPVGPHVIYVNSNAYSLGINRLKGNNILSPSYSRPSTDGFEYVVSHEYGHLREWQKVDVGAGGLPATIKRLVKAGYPPTSRYGGTSTHEAYAEAFAEWVHSGGRDTERLSIALATAFEWKGWDAY